MLPVETSALGHLTYKLLNTRVRHYPFSHFFVRNCFPSQFYRDLIDSLPLQGKYESGKNDYHGRKFANPADSGVFDFLLSEDFLKTVISCFIPDFKTRFPTANFRPKMDLRLVLDSENYFIGPHTDARWKVVSLLFYLPRNWDLEQLGTSIYVPKDPSFRCPGGPHHSFEPFERVWTAPYIPNSCFGFFKTDNSFHGVEPITIPCRRDVLLWNLYDKGPKAS